MGIRARERLLNVLIFVGVVALLFVVGYPQYKESLPSEVKIGVDKSYSSLPFYVAEKDTSRRYFLIEKIKPIFVDIIGDPLQGIKDGLYDIAAVPWYWLMISPSSNGDTIKAFGSIEIKSGKVLDGIVIPRKSKIKKLNDLRGKRLGYLADHEYLINLILTKMAEQKINKIQKVSLQPEELTSAFAENKVDALFVIDPYRAYMVYQGHVILFEGLISSYVVSSLPYMAIVMRKNFVKEENKLAAIRLKNAIEAALSYISRNPEIAKRYVTELNDWPSEGDLNYRLRVPEYQRLAEINLRYVENFQTELVKAGIGTCGIKPSEFLFEKTDFVR